MNISLLLAASVNLAWNASPEVGRRPFNPDYMQEPVYIMIDYALRNEHPGEPFASKGPSFMQVDWVACLQPAGRIASFESPTTINENFSIPPFCLAAIVSLQATIYQIDTNTTLAQVSSRTYQPGDEILFRSGGSWTGSLKLKGSGTSGAPIKVGATAMVLSLSCKEVGKSSTRSSYLT